jgi:hypothetical protein
MVGRRTAAEHQIVRPVAASYVGPFYWQNTDAMSWINVIGGKSIPTARFYKKKGLAFPSEAYV